MTMTDICEKALDTLKTNLELNQVQQNVRLLQLEWGNHSNKTQTAEIYKEEGFPESMMGGADLIIASDVIYLPECVEPLFRSIKHFLNPTTGKCIVVSNHVRIDPY